MVSVLVNALHSRVLALDVEFSQVGAYIVLESEHELFRTEDLQQDTFLEISQRFFPLAGQLLFFWVCASGPLSPWLLVFLYVRDDTVKG